VRRASHILAVELTAWLESRPSFQNSILNAITHLIGPRAKRGFAGHGDGGVAALVYLLVAGGGVGRALGVVVDGVMMAMAIAALVPVSVLVELAGSGGCAGLGGVAGNSYAFRLALTGSAGRGA
jgi:hypothetical protein